MGHHVCLGSSGIHFLFFSKKGMIERLGLLFLFLTLHTDLSLRIALVRPGGTWGASSSLSMKGGWHLGL